MNRFLNIKLLFIILILILVNTKETNAFYLDQETTVSNKMTAGCWSAPSVPSLIYPTNGYIANSSTPWYLNPYMDWSDSVGCPDKVITYQYESYLDSGLTILAYRSGSLNNSRIDAPGTPNGTYYWRVRAYDSEKWSDWSTVWVITVINGKPISPAFIEVPEVVMEIQPEDLKKETLPEIILEPEIKVEEPLLTLEPEIIPELDIEIVSEDIPVPVEQPETKPVPEVIDEVVPEIPTEPIQPVENETPIVEVEDQKVEEIVPPVIEPVIQTEEIIKPELNLEVLNNESN